MGDMPSRLHTDLAVELSEDLESVSRLSGVCVRKRILQEYGIRETLVEVENEEGERLLGKPKGRYLTIEGEDLPHSDPGFHRMMSRRLAYHLERMLAGKKKLLVAGLGNAEVTPDRLGPLVADRLLVTGHLQGYPEYRGMRQAMAIAPGVMAQTGMETGKLLKGVIRETEPDALLVADALAARSYDRLGAAIQVSDTGIAPGSGVGNHRSAITPETMGIPVVAIGVPTVISMPALAGDILDRVLCKEDGRGPVWGEEEKYHFLGEKLDERLLSLFVTPKDIDEAVERISATISEGINLMIRGGALPAR